MVTVTSKGAPATLVLGALTLKWSAAAGVSVMPVVPLIEPVTVSWAVIVWLPAVLKTKGEKVWTPWSAAVKPESAGNVAWPSELVRCTVPA